MKRILTLAVVLALCLALCGCTSKKELEACQAQLAEKDQLITEYKAQLDAKDAQIASLVEEQNVQIDELQRNLENTTSEMQWTIDDQAVRLEELEMVNAEQAQELEALTALYEKHEWAIDYLEDGEYDRLISRLQDEKEAARIAKLTENGVEEVAITLDNWDQYFEYVPTGYVYIRNAFGEATHMNMLAGLRLKDGYTMAPNWGSEVDFEMETHYETYSCTVDFVAETFEYGEVIEIETAIETTTTSFNDYDEGGVNSFGSIAQINSDNGNLVTEEVRIEVISNMLRVEGSLFLCKD